MAFRYCWYLTLVVNVQLCAMNNQLINAVFNNNLQEVIRILTTEDIDINYQDNTALHIAVTGENDIIVQLLLEAGASVHARNHLGQTPLHVFAAGTRLCKSNRKILQLLIQAGADIHAQDANGMAPLHVASYYFNKKAVDMLLKLPNINLFMRNNSDKTALDVAKEHVVFYPDERERQRKTIKFLAAVYVDYIINNREKVTQEQIQQLPVDLQKQVQPLL